MWPAGSERLGESVTEGTVSSWLKAVGDSVEVDEPLLEVATDKVDTEVPSPVAGTVLKILVPEDETVDVGTVLAIIGDPSEASPAAPTPATPAASAPAPAVAEPVQSAPAPVAPPAAPAPTQPAAVDALGDDVVETGDVAPGDDLAPLPLRGLTSLAPCRLPEFAFPWTAREAGATM